ESRHRPFRLHVVDRAVGLAKHHEVARDHESENPFGILVEGPAEQIPGRKLARHPLAGPRRRIKRRLTPDVATATVNPIRKGRIPVFRIASILVERPTPASATRIMARAISFRMAPILA